MRESMSKKEAAAWHWGVTYGILETLAATGSLANMTEEQVQHCLFKFGRGAIEKCEALTEEEAARERERHIRIVESVRGGSIILM